MRSGLKTLAHGLATLIVSPAILSYQLRKAFIGADRALEGSTQALGLIPGLAGVYLRGAFLATALAKFDRSAAVHFGTVFSQTGARIGPNVYIGPGCHLGLVVLERDVLLAAGVHVPSGAATHGTSKLDVPIREQEGQRSTVRIGAGTWVGSAAIVLADVGEHSVIAAGAVVTKPVGSYVVAAGVPAAVIKNRRTPPA